MLSLFDMLASAQNGQGMEALARQTITDAALMEALMPGSAGETKPAPQRSAIQIRGLTPGVAYSLAECCHPIPGDRIVGLRRPGEGIEVHSIHCDALADGVDADWVDLSWGRGSDGGTAQLSVVVRSWSRSSGWKTAVERSSPQAVLFSTTAGVSWSSRSSISSRWPRGSVSGSVAGWV